MRRFSGSPRYKSSEGSQYSEDEAKEWVQNFPRVEVLLLHAGPKKYADDPSDSAHLDSEAIKNYVLIKKSRHIFIGISTQMLT